MVVTQELFAAYLNCPTKAYLISSAIPTEQTKFGSWKADIQNTLRQQGVEVLQKQAAWKSKKVLRQTIFQRMDRLFTSIVPSDLTG